MKHHKPVRKIPTNRRSSRGYYAFRGQESIPHESTVERDFVMLMEFDGKVDKIVSQPIELSYVDLNGRRQRYTPDYLVYFKNSASKPLLVEVKERVEIQKDFKKLKPKFAAGIKAATENGWIFKIADDTRIRGLFLDNVRKLRNFSARSVTPETRALLLEWMSATAMPVSLKDFLTKFTANRNEYLGLFNKVLLLALQHDIELDLTKPLSEKTMILKVNAHD
ncbi:TnsA endonuclease N-terminal domain-containing protein [Pseudidiomarina sp. 1APP75-27a]|uniref:TnsA endonuclease N-terminal domain-containing protein n=1 Tax=Pseudidiomarina terrestris TaxID=2820060 RepID=UPI002B0577EC|nr:TnsA endonuclease N-terminal domain-containing protein [Pseudidiomarina sp. 1APP75-27a]MEA3588402.1 TnsA endonuclease N-terminal domain-containing protein [Pseudidiomarina sp. 1APP75-27a]